MTPKFSIALSRLNERKTSRNENVEVLRCAIMFTRKEINGVARFYL